MPSSIRDAAPDAWGRRVILNKTLGLKGADTDRAELDELTYLLESGSDRIGALDFQRSPTEVDIRQQQYEPAQILPRSGESFPAFGRRCPRYLQLFDRIGRKALGLGM